MRHRCASLLLGLILCLTGRVSVLARQSETDAGSRIAEPGDFTFRPGEGTAAGLSEPRSPGFDLNVWGWLSYLKTNEAGDNAYWDGELSVGITKSFAQRLTLSAQVNFIDADDSRRFDVAQAYLSARPFDDCQTVLTIGKFNANFGVEGRDFWDRTTGTPSLLFGAQPQDLIGAMLTQPIGDTGLTVRPFISIDFQGGWYADQPPSAGLKLEYQACPELDLTLTNWVGPGFIVWGGEELHHPYPQGAYGSSPASAALNWQGPNLVAERSGTLYFVDFSAEWRLRPDLKLSAEYLLGTTGSRGQRAGWQGWLIMGDFDVTDRLHAYGRWSSLDDHDWIITGIFQRRQEISVGAGYELLEGLEVRAEYRHDSSNATSDADIVSAHLTFTY